MGASRVHPLRSDCWYELSVLDVGVGSEAGVHRYSERIDVVFLAAECRSWPPRDPVPGGRPKACIALRFDPDWTPQDDGTRELLGPLGVPEPVPSEFDWEKELANRRILGRFRKAPRHGARNPLGEVRPIEQALGGAVPGIPERESADVPVEPGRRLRDDDRRGTEYCQGIETPRPRWDGVLRRLTWNGEIVASYSRSAPNQATILSAFEEEGWPARIDDPLPRGCLRQTLKDLQEKFRDTPIAFGADGTGTGICWERRTS